MNGTQDPRPRPKSAPPVKAESGRKRNRLTYERAREQLNYNPDTGELTWRFWSNGRKPSLVAGSSGNDRGYRQVMIDREIYSVHRLIWLWWYGYWPENYIDHIDRDPGNNRIDNLREATPVCNTRNSKLSSSNTSGVKGVCWDLQMRKWRATIKTVEGFNFLGYHDDFTEAVAHRLAAEQCFDWKNCDSASSAYLYLKERGATK